MKRKHFSPLKRKNCNITTNMSYVPYMVTIAYPESMGSSIQRYHQIMAEWTGWIENNLHGHYAHESGRGEHHFWFSSEKNAIMFKMMWQ